MKIPVFPISRRWLRALLLLAAASFIPATASAQVNAEQVMSIGRNVMSMEDYMLAIQYFNQAIKAKPYLADPYFFRALAKLNLEDFKGAEADCSLAIERNKYKSEAYKLRGFARQNLGNDSLAIADYNIGLGYNPLDKYFLFYKAVAQTQRKDYNGADSTFQTLLRQYPSFEEGYTARARLHIARQDTVSALADLDKSISLSKSLVNPFLLRAEIEWKRREWEKAGQDLDAAIHLHPDVADLYVNRAFIRYNSDDFFGAMSDYNYALDLDPKNTSALFNRALLRYEVKDLSRAEEDLTGVLALDPGNFHAMYNRGLIRMESGQNQEALQDLEAIARKYPRFYPVYYAMAECRRNMGDMKSAMRLAYHGDDLVKKYVANPEKNPLDRPAIAAAESNDARQSRDENDSESEIEVMEKFNRLVTVADAVETQLSYNERIKGRVQDRNVQVEPEPMYALTFTPTPTSLKTVSNYFRELDDLNQQRLIKRQFYLSPGLSSVSSSAEDLFNYAEDLTSLLASGKGRPVDRLALGVTQAMLKNYDEALANLDKVIGIDDKFTVAYMARAYVRFMKSIADQKSARDNNGDGADNKALAAFDRQASAAVLQDVIADYDKALSLNPRLVFAWFNKGNIYYAIGDYTSAMQCFTEAVRINPEFGEAFFNRGLSYLQAGNKHQAFADLSKAGELGVLPIYNILKRMK